MCKFPCLVLFGCGFFCVSSPFSFWPSLDQILHLLLHEVPSRKAFNPQHFPSGLFTLNSNNRFIKWHSSLTFQHCTHSKRKGFICKILYCTCVLPCVMSRHHFQGFLFICLFSFFVLVFLQELWSWSVVLEVDLTTCLSVAICKWHQCRDLVNKGERL